MTTRALLACLLVSALPLAAFADDAPAPVTRPTIPAKTFAITDFGAVADGKTLNSAAIQKAIDECTKAGGGTVTIPVGTFLTGPLNLASSMNFHLDKGAILQFSANPADYGSNANQRPDLLTARRCHDLSITGEGTIDGSGATWWPSAAPTVKAASTVAPPTRTLDGRTPYLLNLSGTHLLLQDVTFLNAPGSAVYAMGVDNLTVEHIIIKAPETSPRTTGLDLMGKNITVTHSTFDVSDDDLCIHPFGTAKPNAPICENITVADCTMLHGKGIVVGNQTSGGLRNLRVRNCTFEGTQYGIRMRTDRGRGGTVEDVAYENITMNNVKFPIQFSSYFPTIPKTAAADPAQPVTPDTPIWKNIRITKLTASGSMTAGSIVGLAEQPVDGVTLTDVNINATRAMEVTHARNVTFVNSHIAVDKGKAVVVSDGQVTGVENISSPSDALP